MYLNNSRVPLNDQNIRLAVAHAVDRRTYFEAFQAGQGAKNTSPWSDKHWAYNAINDDAFEYDLEKANIWKPPVMSMAKKMVNNSP